MSNVIEEIMDGNGNQFTVKEILQAHIRDNKEAHTKIFDRFEDGNKTFATRTFVKWSFGILMSLLGGLAYLVIK